MSDDLDELAEAAHATPAYKRRSAPISYAQPGRNRSSQPDRMEQIISGFFFSLGWLPVAVIAGLLIAFIIKEYVQSEISDAADSVRQQVHAPHYSQP